MKNFFKPSKAKIIIFFILVILNISVPFISVWVSGEFFLFYKFLYQIVWLWEFGGRTGLNVEHGGDFIANPNTLGLILIILAILISLAIHYSLACIIVNIIARIKKKKVNNRK